MLIGPQVQVEEVVVVVVVEDAHLANKIPVIDVASQSPAVAAHHQEDVLFAKGRRERYGPLG